VPYSFFDAKEMQRGYHKVAVMTKSGDIRLYVITATSQKGIRYNLADKHV
jgi:hypothetical protein